MGIQSTKYITRESCIDRIKGIDYLILKRRYKDLEETTFECEHDYDLLDFVNKERAALLEDLDPVDLEHWTDTMLEDKMDEPFYRFSMFDNYLIREEE